ncbi:50S ribosomal protein L4 [bacterium]|nr:50S ribosomal protein L4 [bacterium]
MPKAKLYSLEGNVIGEESLAEEAFGVDINEAVVHQYVKSYLANQRQGNACTKTRGEVQASGRKPWRQKGTGRARVGSVASPVWRHGGVTFGPRPHSFRKKTPKKMRKIAFSSVLSSRAQNDKIMIIENLNIDPPKTRTVVDLLNNMNITRNISVLFITENPNETLLRACTNIPRVRAEFSGEVNPYDLLLADLLIIQKEALPYLVERCIL